MNDTDGTARSHQFLDDAEHQVNAAVALGRRLLAAQHPDRPIIQLEVHPAVSGGLGLMIWAGQDYEPSVQAWADLLDVPMDYRPHVLDPERVHCTVDGVFEGVPVHAWTILTIPITAAAIVENLTGVRVAYVQGGARRSVDQVDKAAARQWVEKHVPQAVSA